LVLYEGQEVDGYQLIPARFWSEIDLVDSAQKDAPTISHIDGSSIGNIPDCKSAIPHIAAYKDDQLPQINSVAAQPAAMLSASLWEAPAPPDAQDEELIAADPDADPNEKERARYRTGKLFRDWFYEFYERHHPGRRGIGVHGMKQDIRHARRFLNLPAVDWELFSACALVCDAYADGNSDLRLDMLEAHFGGLQ
jgi:hypothetical protein